MDQPVCLVTGGASGIGAACVDAFVVAGYRVFVGDIQQDKGEALVRAHDGAASFVRLDVTRETDFVHAIDAIAAQTGRLDCMVNNAAVVGVLGSILDLPVEEFDVTMAVVFRSVFLGMKHAARVMCAQRAGAMVNIASVAGLVGGLGPHVYSAGKAAVLQLTRAVALELAEYDIRVNAVCPGNTATPLHTGVTDERWRERMSRIRGGMADDQAFARIAEPAEIAAAVVWLAGPSASFVTGVSLPVDGGMTAGRPWRRQPAVQREYHPARRPSEEV